MPRSDEDEELQKHTLNLYAGDMAELQELYPDIGASIVIRKIIRSYINQVKGAGNDASVDVEIKL